MANDELFILSQNGLIQKANKNQDNTKLYSPVQKINML